MYQGRVAVMLIHVGGNHWVGLIMRLKGDGRVQIIFNDPMGYSLLSRQGPVATFIQTIFNEVSTIAFCYPHVFNCHPEFIDLNLMQQRNGDDCGPLTVDNLVRLARYADYLDGLNPETIVALAGLHRADIPGYAQRMVDLRTRHNNFLEALYFRDDYGLGHQGLFLGFDYRAILEKMGRAGLQLLLLYYQLHPKRKLLKYE